MIILPDETSYGGNFGCYITLHPRIRTIEDRTSALEYVIKSLGEELVPGIRNEVLILITD